MKLHPGILVATVVSLSSAQAPTPLKAATGTLKAEFIAITGVRELNDGRVLVSDPRDKRIVVGDFRNGSVAQVGRIGRGPGEYVMALPLLALGGDSSLMADGLSRRWLLFDGAKVGAVIPPDSRAVQQAPFVYGADTHGNLLTTHSGRLDPRGNSIDSSYLVLLGLNTARVDTIARLWTGPARVQGEQAVFSTYDQALLTTDGWVAILRADPYRVDWRAPDGTWTRGAPIEAKPVPLTAREKAARGPLPDLPPGRTYVWPASIPPVVIGYWPEASRDGKLVVRRTKTADHPEIRYDVIDRRGRLERTITLGAKESIVGFGKGTVYVAAPDADDIVRLKRHPWP